MKTRLATLSLLVLGWTSPALAGQVTSISQYGVTWTFDKAYESGQYASGDYWVVGPVTITSVTPAAGTTRNGSAVNPMGGRQAYDDRGGVFDTTDQVSFPLTLQPDQSLVSSASKPDGAVIKNVGCMTSQAVLTSVSTPQAATALRPAYAGTWKRTFDTSQIQWQLLPKLPAPGSAPSGTDMIAEADRPRMDHLSSWEIQNSCAEENWNNGPGQYACYGREVSTYVSDAALYVLLDTPQRDEVAISMIQHGIDNYGVLKAGGNWAPNGGHHSGRKWPIVFAAKMLNDCELLAVGSDYDDSHFGEDGQTYYGTAQKALFGWDCGGGQGTYFENGCSGSGAKDCRDPAGQVDGCPDYRDCCTSAYWVGQALSALILEAKGIWNHDAYFDYVDRWMAGDVSGAGDTSDQFVSDMWKTYRNNLPAPTTGVSCDGGVSTGGASSGGASSGGATGSGGADSGVVGGQGGSVSGTGGNKAKAGSDDSGSCGCRMFPSDPHAWLWLGGAALALGVLRRRLSPVAGSGSPRRP